jgi:DNA-binding XRE family transcriptional regulator
VITLLNANSLKGAIAEAGYTQGKLAEKLGVSVNTLSAKISGKTKFTIDEAALICKVLDITDEKRIVHIFLN